MKTSAIFLALLIVFILAGCQKTEPQTAVVEPGEKAVSEETAENTAPATEEAPSEGGYVNPNYDAKLDGDPTKAPAVEKDEEESSAENSSTTVDQSFMSDPDQ